MADDPSREGREAIIARFLKRGDTITHKRCMGCVEEHIFTGRDGSWLCGYPTHDTMRLSGSVHRRPKVHGVDDIAPMNVTHINRCPVENVPFLAENEGR